VATFRTNDRLGATQRPVFQSDGCTFPQISEHLCYVGAPDPADKEFDGIELSDAISDPFPLYAGVMCFMGPDPDELERAKAALASGQDRALEEVLVDWANGGLAVGTGDDVIGALALVEQALDDAYVGQGVILMSRADAVRADAAGAIHANLDGIPTTVNGTPVLASGRVEPGLVYGLGAIVVEHGNAEANQVMELEANRLWALAEEIFVIAVDCEFRVRASSTDTAPPTAPAITAFTQAEDYTDASTEVAFTLTFTGTSPTVVLQHLPKNSATGTWVTVDDAPTIVGSVYTWAFDAVAEGLEVDDTMLFRVVLTNIAGTANDEAEITVIAEEEP
jgi:hypothetical protein